MVFHGNSMIKKYFLKYHNKYHKIRYRKKIEFKYNFLISSRINGQGRIYSSLLIITPYNYFFLILNLYYNE